MLERSTTYGKLIKAHFRSFHLGSATLDDGREWRGLMALQYPDEKTGAAWGDGLTGGGGEGGSGGAGGIDGGGDGGGAGGVGGESGGERCT